MQDRITIPVPCPNEEATAADVVKEAFAQRPRSGTPHNNMQPTVSST